jgi:hypothetical protein
MDNLDGFQKLVSTIEKSRSRSRFLDLVLTSMSRPKSLDRDWEIRRDLKILAFLDSLSRSRSAWIFVFSRRDFSTNLDKSRQILTNLDKSRQISTNLDKSRQISTNLDKSRQILTISTILTCLDNLDKNLDATKSRLKSLDLKNLDREKKKVDLDVMDNLDGFQKLVSTWWTFSISISIGLKRRDPQT